MVSRSPKDIFNKYTNQDQVKIIKEVDEDLFDNYDNAVNSMDNVQSQNKNYFEEDFERFSTNNKPSTIREESNNNGINNMHNQGDGSRLMHIDMKNLNPMQIKNLQRIDHFNSTNTINDLKNLIKESKPYNHNVQKPETQHIRRDNNVSNDAYMQSNIFKIKRALGLVREMCAGLSNEDTYLKLKMIRETELEVNEYLVVKVYEMISPYISDYKSAKKANLTSQIEIKEKTNKLETMIDEMERQRDEFRRRETTYHKQIETLKLEMKVKENQVSIMKREDLFKENQILMLGKMHRQVCK